MGALLKFPEITHAGGASAAQNQIAELRRRDSKLVLLPHLPCERCGKPECDRELARREYDQLENSDAAEDVTERAFARWLIADKLCIPLIPMRFARVMPEEDVELDKNGFCVLDATDYEDAAGLRRK